MTKKYKHSGTMGDLIYSLALVRHRGGGEFYLHQNQVDWIAEYYYRAQPLPFHQGRMNDQDLEFMRDFMSAQTYITEFGALTALTEITDNLDNFRPLFVGHPGNYIDIYASLYGIRDPQTLAQLRNTPWLTVPEPRKIPGIEFVVNRTERWVRAEPHPAYSQWREEGIDQRSVFVGLESEFHRFVEQTGWRCGYYPTASMLDLASVIAGADQFIGNQSQCLALAIGLGTPWVCEARPDLPLERNECYFPDHPQGDYLL